MFKFKAKRKSKLKQSLAGWGTMVLLFFFVAGNVEVEAIHDFIHAHESSVSHALEDEQDLCHRAIYHDIAKGDGCAHKAHFTKSDKCSLCGYNFHKDHSATQFFSLVFVDHASVVAEEVASKEVQQIVYNLPSRAPPAA